MHVSPKNSKKKKNYSKLQNCRNGKIIWRSENVRPKNCNFKIPWKNSIVTKHLWKSVRDILLDKQRPTKEEQQTRTCDCPVDSCVRCWTLLPEVKKKQNCG